MRTHTLASLAYAVTYPHRTVYVCGDCAHGRVFPLTLPHPALPVPSRNGYTSVPLPSDSDDMRMPTHSLAHPAAITPALVVALRRRSPLRLHMRRAIAPDGADCLCGAMLGA
jgi:hypothetical protein